MSQIKWVYLIVMFLSILLGAEHAFALRTSRPMPIDQRIRIINFNPDDVFEFIGFYGYQSSIEFAADEAVDTISMGDSLSWQIVPAGRRIFLKPMEHEATTNMTVLTNKRIYYFELHAENAKDIRDPKMVFNVRFLYPGEAEAVGGSIQQMGTSGAPDMATPEKYNFNYSLSGPDQSAPIKVFDDGEFTYFQFRHKNSEIPAFFMVNASGEEALVNYRVAGEYIVIERVASVLTLRNGRNINCVFNESMPMLPKKKRRTKTAKNL